MKVEVQIPSEFQGSVVAGINRRMGQIEYSEVTTDGTGVTLVAEVPLSGMFGYSTELRSSTQGKGEFSMEYSKHQQTRKDIQEELMTIYQKERYEKSSD